MSFVDELRYQMDNADEIKKNQEQKRLNSLVADLVEAIKEKARKSPNSRIIKGYVYYQRDRDYGFSIFDINTDLPVLRREHIHNTFVLRTETTKQRVYNPVLCFDSFQKATQFIDILNHQLTELGFKQICNAVKEIPDKWLIIKAKKGLLGDSIKYSLKTDGITYVIYLTIQW